MRCDILGKFQRNRKIQFFVATLTVFLAAVVLSSYNDVNYPFKVNTDVPIQPGKTRQTTASAQCKGCFQSDFPMIIDEPDLCKAEGNQTVDVIFLLVTSYGAIRRRQALRDTWASVTKNNTSNFRHVFLLGNTRRAGLQQQVREESIVYQDILVSDFRDSYRNLTLKTLMGLRWAVTRCRHARFFVKSDDDVWINVPALTGLMEKHKETLKTSLAGNCLSKRIVHRDKRSRWYASYDKWPEQFYPAYCLGLAYFGGMDVAERVVRVSKDVPFFPHEDVYVGICLRRAGLHILGVRGFKYRISHPDVCLTKNRTVAVHGVYADWMRFYWNATCTFRR